MPPAATRSHFIHNHRLHLASSERHGKSSPPDSPASLARFLGLCRHLQIAQLHSLELRCNVEDGRPLIHGGHALGVLLAVGSDDLPEHGQRSCPQRLVRLGLAPMLGARRSELEGLSTRLSSCEEKPVRKVGESGTRSRLGELPTSIPLRRSGRAALDHILAPFLHSPRSACGSRPPGCEP